MQRLTQTRRYLESEESCPCSSHLSDGVPLLVTTVLCHYYVVSRTLGPSLQSTDENRADQFWVVDEDFGAHPLRCEFSPGQ
jgi:hypothetical protein